MSGIRRQYHNIQNRGLDRQQLIDLAVRARTDRGALEELTHEMWPILLKACQAAAEHYPEHHLEVGELITVAWDGLCRCVSTYNPDGGASFAMWCKRGVGFKILSHVRNLHRGQLLYLFSQSRATTSVASMRQDESLGLGPAHDDERLVPDGPLWHAVQFNMLLLPDRQRQALAMRYVDGSGFADIGRAFGISKSRAQQIVQKGVAALRELMAVEVAA